MKRIVFSPHSLHPAAVLELRDWLGITITRDDLALRSALLGALDMFEHFTGVAALQTTYQEFLTPQPVWQNLVSCPVQAITSAMGHDGRGPSFGIMMDDYEIDIRPDGMGRVRVLNAHGALQVSVTVDAGMVSGWHDLPQGIRQGVIRLAAHGWRERESGKPADSTQPPLAVAALWRPWRRMRLA